MLGGYEKYIKSRREHAHQNKFTKNVKCLNRNLKRYIAEVEEFEEIT